MEDAVEGGTGQYVIAGPIGDEVGSTLGLAGQAHKGLRAARRTGEYGGKG